MGANKVERLSGLRRRGSPSTASPPPVDGGRRRLMALAASLAAAGWVGPALARSQAEELIGQFLAGKPAGAAPLKVELPDVADNANAVPLRILIDEAITEQSYCEEAIVVAEKNPRPLVCKLRFNPRMGAADVATRIRLAQTQHVTVLARMNDGRVLQYRQPITVTIGGCGG